MILQRTLEEHLPAEGRLLDIGCGTGGNLPMLQRHGTVTGIDDSPVAVKLAGRFGVPVSVGQLPHALPAGLGTFDGICLFDILEHIEDDHAALLALRPLLATEGLLFITVPALPWLWSRHDIDFGHQRRYLKRGLEGLIQDTGFSLRHCSYFCSLLLPPIAAIRIAGRILGRELGNDFDLPTAGLNRLLHRTLAAEAPVVARHSLPLGSSLLAVAGR